ncbi:NDP-sugar pyrophosphorylase family protein [Bradyrhizobium sp. GM24.11]
MDALPRPKIAETIIHETVRQREAQIGRRCEILSHTRIEYAVLGDYSYLGENCDVADAVIGKFTAIANSVRIGAPNHPMGRPSQHCASPIAPNITTRRRAATATSSRTGAVIASSLAMMSGSVTPRSCCPA